MKSWLSAPSLHIALILAVYAAVWRYFGVFALVWSSPLFAALLARPIMKLASNFRHQVRARVWLPVHGRHFVYRGTTIHVLEDEEHHRWICLADMQAVVGVTASERALSGTYPDRLQLMGRPAQTYMRDDAMVAHLGKEKQLMMLKFRTWLNRSVRVPGARVRKDLRIRDVVNAGLRRRP